MSTCMRTFRIVAVGVVLAVSARAGENKYLGALVSTAAATTNNIVPSSGSIFSIPPGAKLTIVCDAAARLLADNPTTANSGATKGMPIPANTAWPTSVGAAKQPINGSPSAQMAMICQSGTCNCDVWQRDGNE